MVGILVGMDQVFATPWVHYQNDGNFQSLVRVNGLSSGVWYYTYSEIGGGYSINAVLEFLLVN